MLYSLVTKGKGWKATGKGKEKGAQATPFPKGSPKGGPKGVSKGAPVGKSGRPVQGWNCGGIAHPQRRCPKLVKQQANAVGEARALIVQGDPEAGKNFMTYFPNAEPATSNNTIGLGKGNMHVTLFNGENSKHATTTTTATSTPKISCPKHLDQHMNNDVPEDNGKHVRPSRPSQPPRPHAAQSRKLPPRQEEPTEK